MKAVIYARVATAEEEDARLSAQVTACRAYAQERDWALVGEFSEVGSGASIDREQLSRMRDRIAQGSVGAVIVYDLNRLSRNLVHLLRLQAEFGEHCAKLYSVVDGLNANGYPTAIIEGSRK